ncbi:MAG TPA: AMP-binding protein, partial [Acidimicrobiales bacterium]
LRGYGIWSDRFVLNGESRYVIPTPFFHCFGYKAGWMSSLMAGAMAIPLAVFDAERVMAIIEREGVTHMPGPPTMFNAILDHPRRRSHDLTSLRHVMVGATTVAPSLIRRVSDELGIETQLSAYGLTENHALASLSEPEDPLEVVATTAGRPFPEVEMRMVDDDGHEVPAGQPGEILLRSPYAMSGYYADPDATAAALAGGWLHTGDIGRFDDDGRLLVTDRKKDMFIAGGFNVAPAEVEKVLVAIVGVAQVAVVGMPDDYLGEVGAAFVVLDDGASVDPADIVAFAREHLANFKVPRRVELVDQLPMNATGKVVKADLRAWLARPDGAATTGAEPVG